MNSENNQPTVKANHQSSFPKLCFITSMIFTALLTGGSLIFGKDVPINTMLAYAVEGVLVIAGIHATITGMKRKK